MYMLKYVVKKTLKYGFGAKNYEKVLINCKSQKIKDELIFESHVYIGNKIKKRKRRKKIIRYKLKYLGE